MTPSTPSRPPTRGRLRRHALRFLVVAAILLGPNIAFVAGWFWPDEPLPAIPAQVVRADVDSTLPKPLDDDFATALVAGRERAGLPSVSAAIAWDGRLQWAGATGLADVEAGTAATPRSRYRTGSVAKPITAVAMLRLAEDGRLDLDAPVSTYVTGLPAHLAPLTARLLASHRSGVRHYSRVPQWWMGWHENYSQTRYASVADGLALFADDPLRFEPGTGFHYTTFGYSLLARELEAAAGSDFPALLQSLVFDAAGMADTAVDVAGPMPERVAFYHAADGEFTPAWPIDSSYKIAGGGLVSTPADLVRFGVALNGADLVSASGRAQMMTPLALADGTMNPENYALGWRIDDSVRLLGEDRPVRIWHHGGTQPGAAAFLMILPEYGIVVAAMANSGAGAARGEVQETAYELARVAIADRGLGDAVGAR